MSYDKFLIQVISKADSNTKHVVINMISLDNNGAIKFLVIASNSKVDSNRLLHMDSSCAGRYSIYQ